MDYADALGRWHIFPPQQLLPALSCDIIGHFPPAQQVILPSWSLDIMEQVLPSLPWQHFPPLQQAPSLALDAESLPQQAIFSPAWP